MNAVIQERNRVLDLICHAVSSVTNGRASRNNGRLSRQEKSLAMTFGANGLGYTRQIDQNMNGNNGGRSSKLEAGEGDSEELPIDPLGPYTPEASAAIDQAREARHRSMGLRREIRDAIENTERLQETAHKAVNSGMNKKVAETITLRVSFD